MNLFVFGLGYTALHLIHHHRPRFGRIVGTVTSAERAGALAPQGIAARRLGPDAADPAIAAELCGSEALLASIPPGPEGDPALARFAATIAAAPRLRWIGYLSTVGVYGDHRGAWVDEATPPAPANLRSRWRLEAEAAWRDLGARSGKPVTVLRLPGIYGPGRNALRQLRDGTARRILVPGHVFNRVHVDDIAAAILASLARPQADAVYNVTDDEPAPAAEVVTFAARLLGVEPPREQTLAEAGLGVMAASFYAECKRVGNRRLKQELGVTLRYPGYRDGLSALYAAGEGTMSG